jgi:hypothetical protein
MLLNNETNEYTGYHNSKDYSAFNILTCVKTSFVTPKQTAATSIHVLSS